MPKNRNPAKPDAPKPRTWKDEVRAQNEAVERLCVELGIDQAELPTPAPKTGQPTPRQPRKA
jgi:hypothetical protein